MKKSIIVIVVVIILGLIIWGVTKKSGNNVQNAGQTGSTTDVSSTANGNIPVTPSATVTDTTKVSDKLTKYENQELGFTVNYPSAWQVTSSATGAGFIIPEGAADTNTLGKLEASIVVTSG